MANRFTRFLSGVGQGLTNPRGQMANQQHATRVFVDDTFNLSPRTKFLYYVQFEFNDAVIGDSVFGAQQSNEVGLMVKTADLPKFRFDTETKNQYNRKKIIYKQIEYEPVSLTLHDDSAGIVSAMWSLYYGYYIADRNQPSAAFAPGKMHYRAKNTEFDSFRYGLDNDYVSPFLKSASVFTMSRRRFVGYTLINPRITSWSHGDVAYAQGADTIESQMNLEYEAVNYSAGNVSFGSPRGFATLHYDAVPSPLTVAGGGTATLLGPGGVLDGLGTVFGALGSGDFFSSPQSALSTTIAAINTARNIGSLNSSDIRRELTGAAVAVAVPIAAGAVLSGLGNVFPGSDEETTTEAEPTRVTEARSDRAALAADQPASTSDE